MVDCFLGLVVEVDGAVDSVVGKPLVSRWRGLEVGATGVWTVGKVRIPIKFGPG